MSVEPGVSQIEIDAAKAAVRLAAHLGREIPDRIVRMAEATPTESNEAGWERIRRNRDASTLGPAPTLSDEQIVEIVFRDAGVSNSTEGGVSDG